ncbi:uncharacterized protein METZ01_LOCUS331676 [marine metagenome]|uniref:Uncharacterized protein n=1 Tax=marine metagenome TaxID=408172 RepID=A0A382Q304_9ZZZZ
MAESNGEMKSVGDAKWNYWLLIVLGLVANKFDIYLY